MSLFSATDLTCKIAKSLTLFTHCKFQKSSARHSLQRPNGRFAAEITKTLKCSLPSRLATKNSRLICRVLFAVLFSGELLTSKTTVSFLSTHLLHVFHPVLESGIYMPLFCLAAINLICCLIIDDDSAPSVVFVWTY